MPHGGKVHAAWRERPDNLYGMGPLDNLVGLQYRMDHMENLKADAFDQHIPPPKGVRGDVDEFDWRPDEVIDLGEDGEIVVFRPDASVLQVDNELAFIQDQMEEFAGAPKLTMGIRTPGEKTAFEVGVLDTAASRLFQKAIRHFEEHVLEPLLNNMLEIGRRKLEGSDMIRVIDDELGIEKFLEVTREDITATGKIRAVGSKHFIARNQLLQTLIGVLNSPVGSDPAVMNHVSGLKLAELLFSDLPGLESEEVFGENVRLEEQAESQRIANVLSQQVAEEDAIDPDDDVEVPNGPQTVPGV